MTTKRDNVINCGPAPESDLRNSSVSPRLAVAVLTGAADKPYAFGLTTALIGTGLESLDIIAGDELDCPEFRGALGTNFLNLRGDQRSDVSPLGKIARVLSYYLKLIRYAAKARPQIFHILWNNKFQHFDRTLLTLYYRLLGKKIVLTAHNVNAGKRDSKDTYLNRLTLRVQYQLADHIFVHTEAMKSELVGEFGVASSRISVIPFGINNAVPITSLTCAAAKRRLGLTERDKVLLFFGHITPYKGLEQLVEAFRHLLSRSDDSYRLVIAGRPKNCDSYWRAIRTALENKVHAGRVLVKAEFIPDEETEVYFKAADVLVLPYKHIYQSGVLFLGYSFGLPAIATEVGSFREDIVVGRTGFICEPSDPADLAKAIETYFESNLFRHLDRTRKDICEYARERHSWHTVANLTCDIYAGVQGGTQS